MAKHIRIRKSKSKHKSKPLLVILSVVVAILVLRFVYVAVSSPPQTSIARLGSIEKSISTKGYVLRSETLLIAPNSGTLSCLAGEGERVSKDSVVAGVYSGEADESTQLRLNFINEQLMEYGDVSNQEQYKTDDTFSVEFQTRASVDAIVASMQYRDMEATVSEKQHLVRMLDQYKGDGEETTYQLLLKEKAELENSLHATRTDIISPSAGVFSTQIDGYETFFDLSDISKITPDVLDKADKHDAVETGTKVKQGVAVAKIFDNFKWYYAAEIDANDAMDLRINSSVKIRFTDISNNLLPATVCAVNKSNDGRCVVVISCNRYEDLIYRLRKTDTEIVLDTYEGLKVPKSAVHINNGKRGVYVVRDGVMRFKETEVLYTGDSSVILKGSTTPSGVMLYDEVVTSGRDLRDGRKL